MKHKKCFPPDYPHKYYAGDTGPSVIMSWKAKDLSPYTVELRLLWPDGTELIKQSTVITNSTDYSQHKWDWVPTDLIAGKPHVIVRIVDGAGEKIDIGEFYLIVRPTH